MRCISRLIGLLLVGLVPVSALAGYANLAPPPGFGGTPPAYTYQAPANAPFVNGSAAASVTANVGGRAIVVPASMRLATNAAAFAVSAVRASPQALVTGAVASWLLTHGLRWIEGQGWQKQDGGGYVWPGLGSWPGGVFANSAAAQASLLAHAHSLGYNGCDNHPGYPSTTQIRTYYGLALPGGCPNPYNGTTVNRGAASPPGWIPAGDPDFVPPSTAPLPTTVPPALPIPLPVELPVINPSADPVPVPVPLRIPVGDPVPLPGTDPQRYRQPYVDLRPRPTTLEPWRVDLQPGDIEGTDPVGLDEPVPVEGQPIGTPGSAPPAPQEGLCDLYPEASACAKLGTAPADAEIATRDAPDPDLSSHRQTFGPDTAACPAPRVMHTTLAGDLSLSYEGACMFADGIRPVVVGLAYLSAVLSFFGIGRRGGD